MPKTLTPKMAANLELARRELRWMMPTPGKFRPYVKYARKAAKPALRLIRGGKA